MTHEEKLRRFAELLGAARRERYIRQGNSPQFIDRECDVRVVPGKKYTKVDIGSSGVYMVDSDGAIYGIKGYGKVHKGHYYGTLDEIEGWNWGEYRAFKKGAA